MIRTLSLFFPTLLVVVFLAGCNTPKKTTVASTHQQAGFIPAEAQDVHIGMSISEFRQSQTDFKTMESSKLESKVWTRYTTKKSKELSSVAYYFTPSDSLLFQMVITFNNSNDLMTYTEKEFGPPDFSDDRWLLKKETTGLKWDINLWAHNDKLTIRRIEGGSINPQK